MPLRRSCSIDAFEANIAAELRAGKPRTEAVAIAHDVLRRACDAAGVEVPVTKNDADAKAKKPKAKRELTREYLEGALARARKILNPRDFAVIFQAARASAGGQVSAKRRRERRELAMAKAHVEPVAKATRDDPGVAVIFRIPPNTAKAIALENGQPPEDLHCTVAYLGSMSEVGVDGLARAKRVLERCAVHPPLKGALSGIGRFAGGDAGDVVYASVDVPGLGAFRAALVDELVMSGVPVSMEHDYTPHVTLTRLRPDQATPPLGDALRMRDVFFDAVTLAVGAGHTDFRLGARRELPPEKAQELEAALEMVANGDTPPPPVLAMEVTKADAETISVAPAGAATAIVFDNDLGAQVGDLVDVRIDGELVGMSLQEDPVTAEDMAQIGEHWATVKRHTTAVPYDGPDGAQLLFVAAAPNELEVARRRGLVGDDGVVFKESYLDPLGLRRGDVAVGFAVPVLPPQPVDAATCRRFAPHLLAAMKRYRSAHVVALGKVARETLKAAGVTCTALPHPTVIRRRGDSGELSRKLRTLSRSLDASGAPVQNPAHQQRTPSQGAAAGNLAEPIGQMRSQGHVVCRVVKASPEKQIVYGVVLDPYRVDLQREWVPPSEVEATAHGFLQKSRVIGFEHATQANASIVESWVEIYPTPADYTAALENRPHRIFARKFGDDVIHSGTWVAGVKLGDQEWADHKAGRLNAFSVGGFSFKTRIPVAAMPEVETIDLIESEGG
jgi:uracil-DNA glycosylase family 4